MDKKEREHIGQTAPGLPQGLKGESSNPSSPVDLSYFREARLFLGKERATLTFYVAQEVASIHYDRIRDEIFFRGHNVKNMTMSQEQWDLLRKFSEYLQHDERAASLLQDYKTCLEHLMMHHGLSL